MDDDAVYFSKRLLAQAPDSNEDELDADAVFFSKRKEENRQGLLILAHNQAPYGTDEEQSPREDESDSDLFSNKEKEHNYLSSGKDGVNNKEEGDIRVFSTPMPVK